jgi:hypothetical protein
VSRAGLAAKPSVVKAEILAEWDEAVRLSRATLARQLQRLLGEKSPRLGQIGA